MVELKHDAPRFPNQRPSKKQAVQTAEIQQKHLAIISQYCINMQEVCWKVLRLAHMAGKGIKSSIFAGPRVVDNIRTVLGGISDLVAQYAADHAAQGDPKFNKKAWLSQLDKVLDDHPLEVEVVDEATERGCKARETLQERHKDNPNQIAYFIGYDDCIVGVVDALGSIIYDDVMLVRKLKTADPNIAATKDLRDYLDKSERMHAEMMSKGLLFGMPLLLSGCTRRPL